MSMSIQTRNKHKEQPDFSNKKDQGFLQTQSSMMQIINSIKNEFDDQHQAETIKKRKNSMCSIMSQNLFQEIQDVFPLRLKRKAMDIQNHVESNFEFKAKKMKKALIKQLTIVSSFRILPNNLFSQMMVYSYDKPKRSVFGEPQERLAKHRYYSELILMDLFTKYRSCSKNRFYLLYNKSVFLFCYDKNQSSSIMTGFSSNQSLSSYLDSESIQFQRLSLSTLEGQMIMIQNRNINVFWNSILNEASRNDEAFEIASNFDFMCCSQIFPRQIFNGKQNREQMKRCTQFSGSKQLYQIRLEGLLLQQNIKNITKKLKEFEGKFIFEFKYVEGSQEFHNSLINNNSSMDQQ